MKKILITGANSYVGTSFETWLKQWPDDYSVDTVSLLDEKWKELSFCGYDSVFHVAGLVHLKESKDDPQQKELVFLDGMLANRSALTLNATEVTVAVLPAWARPKTDVYALHQGSTFFIWWLRIKPDGAVTISRYRSGTSYSSVNAGAQLPLSACWIAADAFD